MSLSSLQLDAFRAVTRQKSFSAAAKSLGLTQSALSQRVMKLEDQLGATLFVRDPGGVRLTERGERLLRYCESKERLEEEFLGSDHEEISGALRIGSFSTLSRSVLVPVLGGLVKRHPGLRLELINGEIRELPSLLTSGRVDFLFTNAALDKPGTESFFIGHEEYVLVRPLNAFPDIYLDHDPDDSTTLEFFRHQGRKTPKLNRSYLDEIYTILEGVKRGLGQAVAPMHIVKTMKGVEIASGYKPLRLPVYLSYFEQGYYTRIQKLALDSFREEVPLRLSR